MEYMIPPTGSFVASCDRLSALRAAFGVLRAAVTRRIGSIAPCLLTRRPLSTGSRRYRVLSVFLPLPGLGAV